MNLIFNLGNDAGVIFCYVSTELKRLWTKALWTGETELKLLFLVATVKACSCGRQKFRKQGKRDTGTQPKKAVRQL